MNSSANKEISDHFRKSQSIIKGGSMIKFYPIGSKFDSPLGEGPYVLVQAFAYNGLLISTKNHNRLDDNLIPLTYHDGKFGVLYADMNDYCAATGININPQNVEDASPKHVDANFNDQMNYDIIKFFRYIRPLKWGEVDNLRGVVLAVQLDYREKVATFAVSISDGDNFDKRVGREIACQRFLDHNSDQYVFIVDFSLQGIGEGGCLDLLKEHLTMDLPYFNEKKYRIAKKILQMMDDALKY